MTVKEIALSPRWGYVLLFFISLIIPLIHTFVLDPELEQHRYPWGLMPVGLLLLRHFGQFARLGPIIALGLLACSWKIKTLNSTAAIARLATAYYFLATLFTAYGCMLMWIMLKTSR